jgi:hypothetical protein
MEFEVSKRVSKPTLSSTCNADAEHAAMSAVREKRLLSRNEYMLHYTCFTIGIRARAAPREAHTGVPEKRQR